ncbi:MAG: hypothetical protein ACODAJ_11475 [Planctomycetota bacterium]
MRRFMVLAVVVALAASGALGDVLHYAAGGKRGGALEEVTFIADNTLGIYIRDQIASLEVSEKGEDTLKLADGKTVEGKLDGVRFKLPEGVMAIARKEVRAVEVTEGTEVDVWKPPSDTPAEPEPEPESEEKLSPEQKRALVKNRALYKKYMGTCDELHRKDVEAFSRQHKSSWDDVVGDVQSFEKDIRRKLDRRRRASRSSRSVSEHSRWRSDYDRLIHTDHLDQDRRQLAKAKRRLSKMKSALKKGRKQIDDRDELREKRVASVAKGIQSTIVAGKVLSEEQMTRRYEAALDIDTRRRKKR